MMTPQQYKMEVLGQVLSADEKALFPSKHISACVVDHVARENSPHSTVEAGVDWGFDPCRTVLCITEKIFNRRRLLYIKDWKRAAVEDIAQEMARTMEKYGVTLVKADSHPPEYKHQLEKHTKIPIYYIEANVNKDAMLTQLGRKIRQHQLEIPASALGLIHQLRRYRRKMRTGDDLVDALALAIYEPAEPLRARVAPTVLIPSIKARKRLF